MNATTTRQRNPHPEMRSPITDLDLEAQIVLAERAVIERDARIRRRSRAVAHRVQTGVLRHAGGGLAVAVGGLALKWWWAKRHPAPPAPPAAVDPAHAETLAREAGLSIATLLPLIWPLMPHGLRRAVTPGMASTALAFVTPWIAKLFRRAPPAAP